jgi:hypothetical protein
MDGVSGLPQRRVQIDRREGYADIIPSALMQVKKGKIPGTAY